MRDKAFINEVRKKVSQLEKRHKCTEKELESARIFLAMLEKDYMHAETVDDGTLAGSVAAVAIDVLAGKTDAHRKEILGAVLEKGIVLGNDNDQRRQLMSISSILSRDGRVKPTEGKNGHWSLAFPQNQDGEE